MKALAVIALSLALLGGGSMPTVAKAKASATHTVTYDQYSLMIDGKRLYVWSGEFHYWRLPSPSLWRDVLEKMKAGGYNAVSIYFDWGYHSPAPGVYDFTGVRDVDALLDIAQQVGIYVIARPGPYINAETDSGGFPGWVDTQAGMARSSAADYLAASDEWLTQIDRILARHQITNGTGPIILYQIENEYSFGTDAIYMQHLIDKVHADGITVPLFHNDIGITYPVGRWIPGTPGAPELYAWDGYPQGFNCSNPTSWSSALDYRPIRAFTPAGPMFIAEFQGGSFDPWGGPGYDKCFQLTGPDFERVFYKTNIAGGVTLQNFYMTYGGTSWGWLASPGNVYSSYDYGSPIAEGRTLTSKYDVQKEIGYFLASVDAIDKTDPAPEVPATSPNVQIRTMLNPDTLTRFFVLRHVDSTATTDDTFTFPIATTDGAYPTVPQQGQLELNGRDAAILVAGYDMDGQRLVYSTSEIMTHAHIGNRDVALLYGRTNQSGETVLRYNSQPSVTVLAGPVTTTWDATRGDLRLDYVHSGLKEVLVSGGGRPPSLLLLADDPTAATFWRQDATAGPVLARGPYVVRSASQSGSTLSLRGDTSAATTLEVWGPQNASNVTWNGQPVTTASTPAGSRTGQLPGPQAISLPALTTWRHTFESPERLPDFDTDASWTVADHTTTNNPTKPPSGQTVVLYVDDYGFHHGDVWYRGRFTAAGSETAVSLNATTGTQGTYAAWLNGTYLGSHGSGSASFTIPAGALRTGAENVLSVLLRNMGHSEDTLATDAHKQPRGLTAASLTGSTATIAWKIQGTQGGEAPVDAVRGVMNDGGLYGERTGWYLPGYPDGNWAQVTVPHTEAQPGMSWYRTVFSLNLPSGQDDSLALRIDDPPARIYRLLLFVNGWNMGIYINNVGPQHVYPIPSGILRRNGQNTLAFASWGGDDGSGGLGTVSLVDLGSFAGGVAVTDVTSPPYAPPTIAVDSISATTGIAFNGRVATGNVPADAQATSLVASIGWGDSSSSQGTLTRSGAGYTVNGSHVYAAPGTYPLTVTITDRYDGSTLVTGAGTATVGGPTAVTVARFGARRTEHGVTLSWRTGSEAGLAGFNVYRDRTRLNRTLVAARHTGEPLGVSYRFLDTSNRLLLARYRLQLVALDGRRRWYGRAVNVRR